MSPRKIAARVCDRSLDIIAICDHNSAENVPAVMKAAGGGRVVVLPGLEVCTSEEIHVLAIFEDLDQAFAMQAIVYDHLPGENDPDAFGLQVVANEHDEVVAMETRLLIGAIDLPVDRILDEIHRLGGLAIASHIDRASHSVISQLGFIPETLKFDALELSSRMPDREARERFPSGASFALVRNSDAHFLEDVGKNASAYVLHEPTFAEIHKALGKEEGRMVMELS